MIIQLGTVLDKKINLLKHSLISVKYKWHHFTKYFIRFLLCGR